MFVERGLYYRNGAAHCPPNEFEEKLEWKKLETQRELKKYALPEVGTFERTVIAKEGADKSSFSRPTPFKRELFQSVGISEEDFDEICEVLNSGMKKYRNSLVVASRLSAAADLTLIAPPLCLAISSAMRRRIRSTLETLASTIKQVDDLIKSKQTGQQLSENALMRVGIDNNGLETAFSQPGLLAYRLVVKIVIDMPTIRRLSSSTAFGVPTARAIGVSTRTLLSEEIPFAEAAEPQVQTWTVLSNA